MGELTDEELKDIVQIRLTYDDLEDIELIHRAVDEVGSLRSRVAELEKVIRDAFYLAEVEKKVELYDPKAVSEEYMRKHGFEMSVKALRKHKEGSE